MVFPAPSEGSLSNLIQGLVDGKLVVVWTHSPDTDLARWVAWLSVDNYRQVAGVVMDAEDRWPWKDYLFIHANDKNTVVQRVEQGRAMKNGGGRYA